MSNEEANDHESNVTTDHCIRYYGTGGGYLVFRVRMEYHPGVERWFPIEHELIDVSEIEDWSVVREALEDLGLNHAPVKHLPEYSLEDDDHDSK